MDIIKGIDPFELAGMDQTHVDVSDFGAADGLVGQLERPIGFLGLIVFAAPGGLVRHRPGSLTTGGDGWKIQTGRPRTVRFEAFAGSEPPF
jgi:hypothetical protein